MELMWKFANVLEPSSTIMLLAAVALSFVSAVRALHYAKEMESMHEIPEATITLNCSKAFMIPVMISCIVLLMYYLFTFVSQLLTAVHAVTSVYCLYFCLSPYVSRIKSPFGWLNDPFVYRCFPKSFTRWDGLLLLLCCGIVAAWLVSGHWILNDVLAISLCIAFVSHVRIPNIKICVVFLLCFFVYDIFWVYYSERFFGSNVMISVATQQASNPVHAVASSLSLPGQQLITKKLELPFKILYPRNLSGGVIPGSNYCNFLMLGLGDVVKIFLFYKVLVFCFM